MPSQKPSFSSTVACNCFTILGVIVTLVAGAIIVFVREPVISWYEISPSAADNLRSLMLIFAVKPEKPVPLKGKLTFHGSSYGSLLGAQYANLETEIPWMLALIGVLWATQRTR